MAWTTPITRAVGDVDHAADYNTGIRDNLNYLLSGRLLQSKVWVTGSSDYTTTSAAFVDVDVTNLILTLNPLQSGRVFVVVSFSAYNGTAGQSACFDIIVDSLTRAGASTVGSAVLASVTTRQFCSFGALFTGLSVGSHTFKLQYKAGSGTTGIERPDQHPIVMAAWEA